MLNYMLIIFRSAQAALAGYVTADVNLASISPSSILDGGNESSQGRIQGGGGYPPPIFQ